MADFTFPNYVHVNIYQKMLHNKKQSEKKMAAI